MLHSICQQIWETQQWLQKWKRSVFHFSSKEGQCQKHSNTIVLISHASKVLLKILQTTLKQYVKQELQDVQAGFQRGRGTRNLSAFLRSWRKQRNSRKTSTSTSLTMLKPLTVWITGNCGVFLRRGEYQNTIQKRNLHVDQEAALRTRCGMTD